MFCKKILVMAVFVFESTFDISTGHLISVLHEVVVHFSLHVFCVYRLTVVHHTPSPSEGLLRLLDHMVGLLGLGPPTDDTSHSMSGLMGKLHLSTVSFSALSLSLSLSSGSASFIAGDLAHSLALGLSRF